MIVYAQEPLVVSERFTQLAEELNGKGTWPVLADLPMAGTSINAESPVTTILGRAPNHSELLGVLKELLLQVEQTLDSQRVNQSTCKP